MLLDHHCSWKAPLGETIKYVTFVLHETKPFFVNPLGHEAITEFGVISLFLSIKWPLLALSTLYHRLQTLLILGTGKWILSAIVDSKNKDLAFFIGPDAQESINAKLQAIAVPHDMERKPRSLEYIKRWKRYQELSSKDPFCKDLYISKGINFSLNPQMYKRGGRGEMVPPEVFLSFYQLLTYIFSSCRLNPRTHFETSSMTVSFYGYEFLLWCHK